MTDFRDTEKAAGEAATERANRRFVARHGFSTLGAGAGRCPSCGSSNPWFTDCKDKAAARAETGRSFPSQPDGCNDPWHQRASRPGEPEVGRRRDDCGKQEDRERGVAG